MKQWNVSPFLILCLSFSVLASTQVFAQLIEIEDPGSAEQQQLPQAEVQGTGQRLDERQSIRSQPVTISAGMSPQVIPQALPQNTIQSLPASTQYAQSGAQVVDPSSGFSVGAPSTGIGGSNPGNANTGGVQVQSVNLHNSVTQEVAPSLADLMRRERIRKELENEQSLVEQLEKGRLEDEADRAGAIKQFSVKGTNDAGLASMAAMQAPMSVAPAIVPMNAAPAEAASIQEVTLTAAPARDSGSRFRISPMGGYRWFEDSGSEYEATNRGVLGIGLEGVLNTYIGIEGSFIVGRDDFNYRGMNPYQTANNYGGGYVSPYANYNTGSYYQGAANPALYAPRSRDTFEVMASLKLGTKMSKLRPYVLGGIGGLFERYDIDETITVDMLKQAGLQRATTHALGSVGGGVDLEVSQNLALGARFDYLSVLNRQPSEMDRIWGDESARYRVTGSFGLQF